ncbi:MAG: TetR/AcrR family transcriptional regulator [Caulobacterales bacterium]|nr:TetR/AcrR family transcriptional regulator [Caulobacterales bacterium]
MFAAVGRGLAEDGALRLQAVVEETGVSVGSLYHRYGSREGLLARAWLDAVEAFHARFRAALESGAPDAGEEAALATPRFCRAEPERAVILACCRRSEFLGEAAPADLRAAIETVNRDAAAALARYAEGVGAPLEACRLALVAFPLGAVRVYLPRRPVPDGVDAYVAGAYRAVMALARGDG